MCPICYSECKLICKVHRQAAGRMARFTLENSNKLLYFLIRIKKLETLPSDRVVSAFIQSLLQGQANDMDIYQIAPGKSVKH